jgi:Uma2 family endonuclease
MTVAIERPDKNSPVKDRSLDQVVTLQGTWAHFKLIQQGLEQTPAARLFYYKGEIEILMPSQLHETFSHIIGWMLSTFLLTRTELAFTPTGSVTQECEGEAAAQADESYCIGAVKEIPDLSIEIVFTSGSKNKLARYQALGVPEVWFWEDGTLALYHLREGGYDRIEQSELPGLAELDLALLKRCILMAETDSRQAMTVFAKEIGCWE